MPLARKGSVCVDRDMGHPIALVIGIRVNHLDTTSVGAVGVRVCPENGGLVRVR